MKMSWQWVKRRWINFRQGHSLYLGFVLSFINFILIAYNFVLADTDISLIVFTLFFVLLYFPTSILIGHYHNRFQNKTDATFRNGVILERLDEIEKKLLEAIGES